MVTYLPRSAWKARASRGAVALVAANIDGEALHWPGMAKPINATGTAGQARVASALRGWQNYHMDVRGWSDIAYQIAIDQAGRAWTLRGLNIRSGANGDADVNLRFGAFLLILAPGEQPSAAMIETTQGVIADFRKRFPGARLKPYGHRDVRPRNSQGQQTTDCPGDIAESLINAGKFTPGTLTPPVKPPVKPPVPDEGVFDMAVTVDDLENLIKKYVVADNNHDAQAAAWTATAQAYAAKRFSEGADFTTVKDELFKILAPLWSA